MSHQTLTDRLETVFRTHPGEWLPWYRLASVQGGGCAWRSRLTDLRRDRGMCIENRLRPVKAPDGSRINLSEYRYVPTTLLELADVQPQQENATC